MTTLAYKDGVLAADSQVTAGAAVVGDVLKIKKTPKYLVGFTGNLDLGQAFIRWVVSDFAPNMKPIFHPDTEFELSAIVVDKKGKIRTFDELLLPIEYKAKFYALGSGSDYALGAMAHGASAKEAVRVAAKFDVNTGGPFRTVSFKKGQSVKR